MSLKHEHNIARLLSLSKLVSVFNMGESSTSNGFVSPQEFNSEVTSKILVDKPLPLTAIIRNKDKQQLIKYKEYSQAVLVVTGTHCDYDEHNIYIQCILSDDELWRELANDLQHIMSLENIANFNIVDISILVLSLGTLKYV